MKRMAGISLVIVMLLSLVLASCSTPAPTPTKAPTATPVPQATPTPTAKILKIGVTQPLTGSSSQWGKTMRDQDTLWTERVNNAGGLVVGSEKYMIQAIYEDDKYTAEAGRAAAEKLIFQDKVKIIIHHGGSQPASAIEPITEENGVLLITCTWDPNWFKQGSKLTFGTLYDGHMQASAVLKIARDNFQVKTMVQSSSRGPTETRQMVPTKEVESQFGITTIGDTLYEVGTKDFTSILSPLLAKKPDMFLIHGNETDTSLQIKQARELGYKGLIATFNPVGAQAMQEVVGAQYAEGVLSNPVDAQTDAGKKFKADFQAKFGYFDTLIFNPCLAEANQALYAGITKAGSLDPAKIAAAMEGLKFDTVNGTAQFAGKGKYGVARVLYSPIYYSQFKSGAYQTVGFLSVDDQIAVLNKQWPPAY